MLFGFVNTKFGLKSINMSQLVEKDKNIHFEQVVLSPDQLFLGPDHLKDNYTNLYTSIKDSPHYYLMKDIDEHNDLSCSIYINKFYNGVLDWRHIQPIVANYEFYLMKFRKSSYEIHNNIYPPVIVYRVNGVYYIADGKHRAALCAYLNKEVVCKLIDAKSALGVIDKYLYSVMLKKNNYFKHIEFYKYIWK